MAGLDLTHQLQATPERIAQVRAVPGRLALALADLMVFFSGTYTRRHDGMTGAPVHDPCSRAGAHSSRALRAGRSPTSLSRPAESSPVA